MLQNLLQLFVKREPNCHSFQGLNSSVQDAVGHLYISTKFQRLTTV